MSVKKEWYEKEVRKILMDPQGREALKKYGIDVEVADEKEQADKPTVVILVPTYRAPEPQMSDSLRLSVEKARQSGAIVYSGAPIQASVVHWSRNMLITEHLKSGKPWTHALFIDDDMVIPEDGIAKLLSHKKDIIGGLCTRRNDPPVPTIRHYDSETGLFEQIWEWPKDKTFEVGGIGAAFLLVTRHALEQVAQAYFDCLWEKDTYHVSDEWVEKTKKMRLEHFDKTATAFWFRFLPSTSMAIEQGEDMSFCLMARKYCGLSIWCDSSVQPGHIGNYPYSIRDFYPYQQALIADAKQSGRFRDHAQVKDDKPSHSFILTHQEELVAQ